MENVVLAVFEVESEAYQALSELRQAPVGEGYVVAEAALLKNADGRVSMLDAFTMGAATTDDTAAGMVVGSLVGILGGPFGVLLGAGTGALVGSMVDTGDAVDELSAVEVMAGKLFEGEVGVAALVQEEEPAFDAFFEGRNATIVRYDAADIVAEVDRARELVAEMRNQAAAQLRAERKAQRADRVAERKAAWKDRFDEVKAKGSSAFANMKDKAAGVANSAAAGLDATVDAIDAAGEKLPDEAKEVLGME